MHTDGFIKSFTVPFDVDSCGRERGELLVYTLLTFRRPASSMARILLS